MEINVNLVLAFYFFFCLNALCKNFSFQFFFFFRIGLPGEDFVFIIGLGGKKWFKVVCMWSNVGIERPLQLLPLFSHKE